MDDDQEICRVCRSESTPDHPLYHPCKCSGSIRFVHEDCLIEWLSHSKKKYCELCEYSFIFSPIYRDDMPERLPFYVLCTQFISRLVSLFKTCLRALTVMTVWLVMLPNFTLWTWRFYFWSGENIGFNTTQTVSDPVETMINTELLSYQRIKSFLLDCLEGQIITACVIIIFVAAYLFREWVMQNLPAEAIIIEENRNVENQDLVREQLRQEQQAIDTLLNAMQVLNPPDRQDHHPEDPLHRQLQQLRGEVRDEMAAQNHLEDPFTEWSFSHERTVLEDDQLFNGLGQREDDTLFNSQREDDTSFNGLGQDNPIFQVQDEQDSSYPTQEEDSILNQPDLTDPSTREEGSLRLDRQEDSIEILDWPDEEEDGLPDLVDIRPEREDPLLVEFERQLRGNGVVEPIGGLAGELDEPLDIGDDMNGILEAIGMRGNPWVLVQNSVLMSLMISLCLGVAVWIPYVIGRLVILIQPITFIKTPIYLMRMITDPLVDFVLDLCVPFIWRTIDERGMIPEKIEIALKSMQEHPIQPNTTQSELMDWGFSEIEKMSLAALTRWHEFATGRGSLDRTVCILVGYLILISLGSLYLTQPTRKETIRDLMIQQAIFLKVFFFILIELVLFPTLCGILLDLSTLPLFKPERPEVHPSIWYGLHWMIGTGVLYGFGSFITICREIIRPGVMWFIRDPNDPEFHPVQDMVERPILNLLQKISQSAVIYSGLLVFGIGTVTYGIGMTDILPLSFGESIVLDLLRLQWFIPPLMMLGPKRLCTICLTWWWHQASRQLELESFMFQKDQVEMEGGMKVRVPRYDSVPVDPKRRMIVPVDPITLEAIDPQERAWGHPAAKDSTEEQTTVIVYIPPHFKRKVFLFLFYMWFSISIFTCTFTVLPLLIGRFILKYYFNLLNDIYAFGVGIYIMAGLGVLIYWAQNVKGENQKLDEYLKEKAENVIKLFYLSNILGILFPLLLGVLVDLFLLIPFRDIIIEKGIKSYLLKNWSLGLVYLSVLNNFSFILPANNIILQKMNEFIGEDLIQVILTRAIIVPMILSGLLSITIPGMISWVIIILFDPIELSSTIIIQYTYPTILSLFLIGLFCFSLKKLFNIWIETVRDDTYLIGKRLHNMKS